MRILKHGKKFDKNRIVTCEKCMCKFEYDKNDTVIEKGYLFTTNTLICRTYIKCPECNTKMLVGVKSDD